MDVETDPVNEDVLVRYLLGELPDEERDRLEERAFTDPGLTAEIQAVECDLIDEYVRGELSDSHRRFESRFLASASLQRKVEFARAFAQVAAAARGSEQPAELRRRRATPAWLRVPTWLLGPVPALRFVTAAALLLLLGGAWLATERVRLRTRVTGLQADLETLERREASLRGEAAEARERSAELAGQLELERQRTGHLARESAVDRVRRGADRTAVAAVLFLPPGVGRSAGGGPELVLPESAEPRVQLRVGLEPEDDYASFAVELRTLSGRQVWRREELGARESPAGRVLDLSIPESLLGAGEYELHLMGVTSTGGSEDVRYYYFAVLKR